jgi:hypothetical protein
VVSSQFRQLHHTNICSLLHFVLPSPTNLRLPTHLSIGSNNHPPAGPVTGITIHSGVPRTVVPCRNRSIGSHWCTRFQRLISSAAHLKQSPQDSISQLASSCTGTVSWWAIGRDCLNCVWMVSLQTSFPSSICVAYRLSSPFLASSKLSVAIVCLEYSWKGSAASSRLLGSEETSAAQLVHRRILNPLFIYHPSSHHPITLRSTQSIINLTLVFSNSRQWPLWTSTRNSWDELPNKQQAQTPYSRALFIRSLVYQFCYHEDSFEPGSYAN